MSVRKDVSAMTGAARKGKPGDLRLRPIVQAIALTLLAQGASAALPGWMQQAASAPAQPTLPSPGRSAGQMPGTGIVPVRPQVDESLRESLNNMGNTLSAIAAQQARQAAARSAARDVVSAIPNGLGEGGLNIDGSLPFEQAWRNADAPVQTVRDGQVTVDIKQTADKAILNWETFNVGRDTTVSFDQQSDWAVLNRVNDPNARPSQIAGQIKADGTVLIINRNGVVFTGSSQVNVRNLAVAAVNMTDQQFTDRGIYSAEAGSNRYTPSFGNDIAGTGAGATTSAATADVIVEAGAQITTHKPASVTQSGGYVLLAGREVHNQGVITTQGGQTTLAAGDSFIIRRGFSTAGNQTSTTRGNEIATRRVANSEAGLVRNSGLIQSSTGDITLAGHVVQQAGVVLASTSVNQRGTIHLLNAASDNTGSIELKDGSVTAILLEDSESTGLDSQRENRLNRPAGNSGDFDNLSGIADRGDLSRLEINTGGTASFESGSMALATGGEVVVSAVERATVARDATIDVSGAVGVKVAMEANSIQVNIQGNEQRDSPVNREAGDLNSERVWVDVRDLIFVPAGTNGYAQDRWYTAGGLLEVGGYLANQGRSVQEWMAQGGAVTFTGNELVTQQHSRINVSGGTLDVQAGYMNISWLKGADGRLYELSSAPGDIRYTGVYKGFERRSERWGQTDYHWNPLVVPQRRLEDGYTVGRDAGRLVVSTASASLQGDLIGEVYQGERQVRAPQAGLEGYYQSQTAVARRAQLIIGQYLPYFIEEQKRLAYQFNPAVDRVQIGGEAVDGALWLGSAWLNAQRLGGLSIAARHDIAVRDAVEVDVGGSILLYSPNITVQGNLVARSGDIQLGNVNRQVVLQGGQPVLQDRVLNAPSGGATGVTIAEGVALNVEGLWSNLLQDGNLHHLAWINGGSVSVRSTGDVRLLEGSEINAASGALYGRQGELTGGRGGHVRLVAGHNNGDGDLTLDGVITATGVQGGGSLRLSTGNAVVIGNEVLDGNVLRAGQPAPAGLRLSGPLVLGEGDVLPFDYAYQTDVLLPGEVANNPVSLRGISAANPLTTEADWYLAPGAYGSAQTISVTAFVQNANGAWISQTFRAGDTIPAGAQIRVGNALSSVAGRGFKVPSDVFPDGLPVTSHTRHVAAGTTLTQQMVSAAGGQVVGAAGTFIVAGAVLHQDVSVESVLNLDTSLFASGFSHYELSSRDGVLVAPGARLDVVMPVYRATAHTAATAGDSAAAALETWLPPVVIPDSSHGTGQLRQGADLILTATGAVPSGMAGSADAGAVRAGVEIGHGASVVVDPGRSISLTGADVRVQGEMVARGGAITLKSNASTTTISRAAWADLMVEVGETGSLDVSGVALGFPVADGDRVVQVSDGGTLVLGGDIDESKGDITGSVMDAFVVVREGAALNAAGTQAMLDLPGQGNVRVASDGGSVSLASDSAVYLAGQLDLSAGGANASGGRLAIAQGVPVIGGTTAGSLETDHAFFTPRELKIYQTEDSVRERLGDAPAFGVTAISAESIRASGADQLSLLSEGVISFDGDITLSVGRSLHLYNSLLGLTPEANDDAQVILKAPYVRLAGIGNQPQSGVGADALVTPVPTLPLLSSPISPETRSSARLAVEADHVDIRNLVRTGIAQAPARDTVGPDGFTRRGFNDLNLQSTGDIRFLAAVGARSEVQIRSNPGSYLRWPGEIAMTAAQIYPATGAMAGMNAERLVFARAESANASGLPYSVFGFLELRAQHIEQGGVLRAPLGTIQFGRTADETSLTLLPGSETSISAAGLVIPYGGTVDGIHWMLDGEEIDLSQRYLLGDFSAQVQMNVTDLMVEDGAVIDISGGGELLGAGFIAGRGGSSDVRFSPLISITDAGPIFASLDTHPVYAIVPGHVSGYAPVDPERGAVDPVLGQQITIPAGVPGLAPGTYTLMPSTYALLPGAFRVEINGNNLAGGVSQMRNGSWLAPARLSIAGTTIGSALAQQVILTPADLVKVYSQYNDTTYSEFVRASAATAGRLRVAAPEDAKLLRLNLVPSGAEDTPLRFEGLLRADRVEGGYGASVVVTGSATGGGLEIVSRERGKTEDFSGISLEAETLNALAGNAERLVVGANLLMDADNPGMLSVRGSGALVVREGATLAASEVILGAARSSVSDTTSQLVIERGASITTLGRGAVSLDARSGYTLNILGAAVVASNGSHRVLVEDTSTSNIDRPAPVSIGVAGDPAAAAASLYSEGSLAFATGSDLLLDDSTLYGTRNLALALGAVNLGDAQALNEAAAAGVLPDGFTFNQTVLERLLQGDTSTGAPAMEAFSLSATSGLNVFGDVTLSTLDEQGASTLGTLVLTTPAIMGAGNTDNAVTIETGHLIWNGTGGTLPAPVGGDDAAGPGSGAGRLNIHAEVIELGYGPDSRPGGTDAVQRMILGFSDVVLRATERFTANNRGELAVYQSRGEYVTGEGWQYVGGNLRIETPLITAQAGAVSDVRAGGNLMLTAFDGAVVEAPDAEDMLGGSLSFRGQQVTLDTQVMLPSGKLALSAEEDLLLTEAALIDVAGRKIIFDDINRYSWGGSVSLESSSGDVHQQAGSRIDLSAEHNHAGTLTVQALHESAGRVFLLGDILGATHGEYDAGGTQVPYEYGRVDIRAQDVGHFADLNARLSEGEVFGARHFQIKQGDLVIGDELKARDISVSLDNGHLTVDGRVDASGEQVGSIRLAGKDGLTLTSRAVLDAHGKRLRVDSYGQIIEAPNRAIVELHSGEGDLILAAGSRIDVRHGTAAPVGNAAHQRNGKSLGRKSLGTVTLTAPRLESAVSGDLAIDVQGTISVEGARSIAVQGNWRYDDAAYGADEAASGRPYQVIDQDYLDAKHRESERFINAALDNDDLLARLAGLREDNEDIFHLRPSVEIISATADGDLVIQGDLDLSEHRYASLNPDYQRTALAGSGEAGALAIRAGGDLNIYGSINDGFAAPHETPDDNGWVLLPGINPYRVDVVVPSGNVTLAQGTRFPAGRVLNYEVPLQAFTVPAGLELPISVTLNQTLVLPANTVLRGAVTDHDGNHYTAGTLLDAPLTLNAGATLGAGFMWSQSIQLAGLTWPAGVPLPAVVQLATDLRLKVGAIIPAVTDVVLPGGAEEVSLRPVVNDQQGRNWAVAQMLPSGSASWDMRLVAGADTDAADTRSTRPAGLAGHMVLSDHHYQFARMYDITNPGVVVWAPGNLLRRPAFTLVSDADLRHCSRAAMCLELTPGYYWSAEATGRVEGEQVPENNIRLCTQRPTWCHVVGDPNAPPGEVIVTPAGRVYSGSHFSLVRTGTGDLDLIAAGDVRIDSLYGIYTAGTPVAVDSAFNRDRPTSAGFVFGDTEQLAGYESLVNPAEGHYQAWFPESGGNLTLRSGGSLTGTTLSISPGAGGTHATRRAASSSAIGNWLWRQGTGETAGVTPVETAWWINFGTYVKDTDLPLVNNGANALGTRPHTNEESQAVRDAPYLVGFTGVGTLGGGNLNISVARDAGIVNSGRTSGLADNSGAPKSEAFNAVVGSSGYVDGASAHTFGGGDMAIHVGGAINPQYSAQIPRGTSVIQDVSGLVANLRGSTLLSAQSIGVVERQYGGQDRSGISDQWQYADPLTSFVRNSVGGLVLSPGDSAFNVNTVNDLAMTGVTDPGRVPGILGVQSFEWNGAARASGDTWFTLWTDHSAVRLWSAGGDVSFGSLLVEIGATNSLLEMLNTSPDGSRFTLPGTFSAVSGAGSVVMGAAAAGGDLPTYNRSNQYGIWLAPASAGGLELLAAGNVLGGNMTISPSSAPGSSIASIFNPGFTGEGGAVTNSYEYLAPISRRSTGALFAHGPNSPADVAPENTAGNAAAVIYARDGHIIDLNIGEIINASAGANTSTWYAGAGPVSLRAGGDIINSGSLMGSTVSLNRSYRNAQSRGNLFVHHHDTDISRVSAGGRILTSNFNIAGPGLLEVSAGGSILMQDRASIVSLGPVVPGDNRRGADIAVMAGLANAPLDVEGLLDLYLDPARLAEDGVPLAEQPDRVAATYGEILIDWLAARYGFQGDDMESALAVFAGLTDSAQQVFARQVLFAELLASGREYNDAEGPRPGSYLRGRRVIDAAFPERAEEGVAGDLVMFGNAGIQTLRGGDIHLLTPSGAQTLGVEGSEPSGSAGIMTLGEGSIRQFSRDSILLGQSRVMTVFGGDIQAWSEEGDINAGRGSQTTQVYTPPLRVYDQWGNVTLSPNAPSSGAGIATLNPIAEVEPGDIDLIAPLGTIDAGEAGIRVSGNVNIAALQVLNADNIQVQGDAQGIPVVATVNTSALTSASAASTAAAQAAETVARRAANDQPSIITVEILGFGEETLPGGSASQSNPVMPLEVLGTGPLTEREKTRLTEEERANLM